VTNKITKIVASFALAFSLSVGLLQSPASADTYGTTASTNLKPGDTSGSVKPVDPETPEKPFPGDPGDSGNGGTGSTGPLTLDYVPNLTFKQDSVTGQVINTTAENSRAFVQVSDRRYNGAGWKLYLTAGSLTGQADHHQVTHGDLALGQSTFKPKAAGTVSGAPTVTVGAKQDMTMNVAEIVAHAAPDHGLGTWMMRINANSSLPARLFVNAGEVTQQQLYTGILTWQLTDTP